MQDRLPANHPEQPKVRIAGENVVEGVTSVDFSFWPTPGTIKDTLVEKGLPDIRPLHLRFPPINSFLGICPFQVHKKTYTLTPSFEDECPGNYLVSKNST